MSRLRFYYNTEKLLSERVRYFNAPILWTESLTIHAVSSDYIWEEFHNNSNIQEFSISSKVLYNVITRNMPGRGLIIDADNVVLDLEKGVLNTTIGSFVICNDLKPIICIDGYEDLPLLVVGNSLTINWFNGIERILLFDTNTYTVPNTLLYQQKDIEIDIPYVTVDRSNLSLPFAEELDKSVLRGKNLTYKDISITGKAHPLTGDLVSVYGAAAISQSLKNILLANTYDRPFSSKDIAGNLNAFLFEFADDITNSELKTGIIIAINNYEKRISVLDIITTTLPESYSLSVKLTYMIHTTNSTQEFSLILDRA